MSYHRTCPVCGANLDPGERCDCQDEKTAADAANIDDGKVEQKSDELQCSASSVNENKEEIKYEKSR